MRLGERFREGEARLDLLEGLFALAGILIIVGVAWVLHRFVGRGKHRHKNSPRSLFNELCRAHHLGGGQKRILRDLASYHGLEHPALLFADASYLSADPPEGLPPRISEDSLASLARTIHGSNR